MLLIIYTDKVKLLDNIGLLLLLLINRYWNRYSFILSAGTASQEWRLDNGFPQRAAYCSCKKAKETCENDDMVTCSNEECQNKAGKDNVNWFHYACVSFSPNVDKEFFCTQTCKEKFLKEMGKRKRGL